MRPNMSRFFFAGFVGTLFITLMMYFVSPMMSGGPIDIAALLSGVLGGSWAAGMVAHLVIGTLIFPAVYGLLLFHVLTGSPAVRGMTWGLMLWLLSQAVVMPLLGGGFFSSQAGGLKAVMDSLIGHLSYGFVFGVVAGSGYAPRSRGMDLGSQIRVGRAG